MLVLSRQKDEEIYIILDDLVKELTTRKGTDLDNFVKGLTDDEGDIKIKIMVVDVRGDKVRLGTTAPKRIPVHRREVFDAIQHEKAEREKAEGSV